MSVLNESPCKHTHIYVYLKVYYITIARLSCSNVLLCQRRRRPKLIKRINSQVDAINSTTTILYRYCVQLVCASVYNAAQPSQQVFLRVRPAASGAAVTYGITILLTLQLVIRFIRHVYMYILQIYIHYVTRCSHTHVHNIIICK